MIINVQIFVFEYNHRNCSSYMCTSLVSIFDPISKSSHRRQLFSYWLTPHCFAFATIYPPLCPQTKGGVSHQFIQTPNTHGSSNCKATDASSNYTLLYKNQYFVRFSTASLPQTHTNTCWHFLSLTHTHTQTWICLIPLQNTMEVMTGARPLSLPMEKKINISAVSRLRVGGNVFSF